MKNNIEGECIRLQFHRSYEKVNVRIQKTLSGGIQALFAKEYGVSSILITSNQLILSLPSVRDSNHLSLQLTSRVKYILGLIESDMENALGFKLSDVEIEEIHEAVINDELKPVSFDRSLRNTGIYN